MAADHKHAELQENLHRLLDSVRNVHIVLDQPDRKIEDHTMNIPKVVRTDVAEPEQRRRLLLQHPPDIHRQKTELLPPIIDRRPPHSVPEI